MSRILDTDENDATTTGNDPDGPHCAVCKKVPEQIPVYVRFGLMDGITATDYVIMNEGTFNYRNNLFYCDRCYVLIGMPPGKAVPV